MSITRLAHYLVLAQDLEATRAFYTAVLGLEVGPRPPFGFAGYWLYADGVDCVHLADAAQREDSSPVTVARGSGALDHVAFAGNGLARMLERLREHAVPVRRRTVPDQGLKQLFVTDPNGITIELNYAADEPEPNA